MTPATTAQDVVERLRGLTRKTQEVLAAYSKELDLSATEFLALIRATTADSVTGAQLARAFGMRSSSVTNLADRLEARGLIARRPHPSDRRSVVLRATRRGRSAVTRAIGPLLERLLALAGELGADERATIAAFLDGIDHALRASLRRPAPARGAGANPRHGL